MTYCQRNKYHAASRIVTRNRGNCECIATWGRPSLALCALITTPCQVWCRQTYPLPYYSVFAADTLLYDVTLISDPVTLNLWPSTFASYRLWRDKTLYGIWTQSNNPHRSSCDYSVWPYDLEYVLSVALGSGIIFKKFDLGQLIRAWIIAFLMLIRYVTLWPDLSHLNLEILRNFGCHAFKVHTKFERNRVIHGWVIDDLARFHVQF